MKGKVMQNFEQVLTLAREVKDNPTDRQKAERLAAGIIEVDQNFSSGTASYPSHWKSGSTR
jgi:hypothetical protein